MPKTKAIPDGYTSVIPHIVVRGVDDAIAFYQRAFGAEKVMAMPGPDGKSMHGEVRLGGGSVMLAAENEQWGSKSPLAYGGTPVTLTIYVEKCDESYQRALKAGATSVMEPVDMFWGDRFSQVRDPFGHLWSIMTHLEDLSPEQIQANMKKQFGDKPCG